MDVTRKGFLRLMVVFAGASAVGCPVDPTTKDTDGTDTDGDTDVDTDTTPNGSSSGGSSAGSGGSSSSSGMSGSSSGMTGPFVCMETIDGNHGHELVVTDADVVAGVNKQYDIQGTSAHPHTLSLSAADFATLAAGGTVVKDSSTNNGHPHTCTITCMQ